MHELKILVPFVFSNAIDPRAVYTVGDQLLSEHIFAYHNSASHKKTVLPLFSKIVIDKEKKLIQIELIKDILDSNGEKLSFEQICESVKSSFSGTQHTRYSSLIENIECTDNKIKVKMTAIPVNIEYWLRSTDFAIADITKLPIDNTNIFPTTGPYWIKSFTPNRVELRANRYFPQSLIANSIKEVTLESYSSGQIHSIISHTNFDLAYLYGYSIEEELLIKLKERGFNLQIFPNEWLVYIGFQKSVPKQERQFICSIIDKIRNSIQDNIFLGSPAYSTTPQDRAYGLSVAEYNQHKEKALTPVGREIVIATLDEWINIPLFKLLIEGLQKELPLKLKVFSRDEMVKIYSVDSADLFLSPMGISAADPLGNYSFMMNFELVKQTILEKDITDLYVETDFNKFTQKVKNLEIKLLQERVLIPIGHFPGIVVESPKLKRDEIKSWDWGIQAWTYSTN